MFYRRLGNIKQKTLTPEINSWINKTDKRVKFFFKNAIIAFLIPWISRDRLWLIVWYTLHSFKLRYLGKILLKTIFDSKKARKWIGLTRWPQVLLMIEQWLMLLDIKVVVIRSNITSTERTETADRFNSKISTIKVLLSTYQTYSTGLNLYSDCATMVLFDLLENSN